MAIEAVSFRRIASVVQLQLEQTQTHTDTQSRIPRAATPRGIINTNWGRSYRVRVAIVIVSLVPAPILYRREKRENRPMVGRDVYTANLIIWAPSYGAPTKREVLLLYQQGGFPLPTQKPVMHSQPPRLRKRYVLGGESQNTQQH